MSRFGLTISVRGEKATARLRNIASVAENTRPVLETVARLLMLEEAERFATRGYGTWPGLDADTVRRKAREHEDPRVLHVTGTLEEALTVWRAPGQYLRFKRDEVIFGLQHKGKAWYGRFHNRGDGHNPKRPIVGFTPEATRRIRQAVVHHFKGV